MALVDDILKGFDGGVTGIALGIGTAILAPIIIPVLAESSKSLTKVAIKEGILAYEKSKEAIGTVTEVFEDIVAEAKVEIAQEQKGTQAKVAENPPEVIPITD
jgi:hypothetical protein